MKRKQFTERIERERDARLVNDLVERNIAEMTPVSRFNAEKVLEWFAEKHDCDWREVYRKQQGRRLGNE